MSGLDPSNYSREPATSTPFVYARYQGDCATCETVVQTTPKVRKHTKQTALWVRCRDCGRITHCERVASKNHHESH